MKNFIVVFIILVLVMALAGCSKETVLKETPSDVEPEISESADVEPVVEGNFYDEYGFTVTRNGETVRYYPTFMQNYSEVVYDENCNPTVIAGGALTAEEVESREDVFFDIPTEEDWALIMQPNTKATYDLHGFIQNIYYEVPVGSGNYQLSPPEFDGVDDVMAQFAYGSEGSPVTLAVGGKMGDWTLSELEINYRDGTDEINRTEGTFTGSVVLDGKIVRNEMLELGYDFIVNEDEASKIPHYVSPEGIRERRRFLLTIPEGLVNSPNLDFGEEMYCRIYVSEYRFDFAYTECMDGMTVTQIEPMSDTAKFSLGYEGEAKNIKAGDTLGDWKVDKVSVIGEGEFSDNMARFIGDVTLKGYIYYNELGVYEFIVDESDWNKMPFFISDYYKQEEGSFTIHFPEGEGNPLNMKYGEKLNCSIKISDYTFKIAPKPVGPYATVTEIIK